MTSAMSSDVDQQGSSEETSDVISDIGHALREQWLHWRERLAAKRLLIGEGASLALRIPGSTAMWFGRADDDEPRRIDRIDRIDRTEHEDRGMRDVELHAAVLAAREDACAIAFGGGRFGAMLADFGGAMPGVFDEQVRHLGLMPAPIMDAGKLEAIGPALARGGNVLIVGGRPLVLGTTPMRLGLNAELFEKCATAYVLAAATGGPVRPLPWIVRHVANGRLLKDERRARERVRAGLLPEEAKGY